MDLETAKQLQKDKTSILITRTGSSYVSECTIRRISPNEKYIDIGLSNWEPLEDVNIVDKLK